MTLYLLIAFVLGLIISALLLALKQSKDHALLAVNQNEINSLSSRMIELKNEIAVLASQLSEKDDLLSIEKSEVSKLEEALSQQQKQSIEKLQLLENAKMSLTEQFENLANKIFEEKGKIFSEQNQIKLDGVLKPFQDQLKTFEKKVDNVYVDEAKERASLKNEVNKLFELSQVMNKEAQNLTKALKGDKQKQGAWGELILERVLESSGLRKGIEYEVQVGLKDDENRAFRPDVIVRLPDDKDVIIDSKVSLVDYEAFVHAEAIEKEGFLKRHIEAIKRHIESLAEKKYEDLEGVNSLDFILMFMPIESAFILAFQNDSKIFQSAFEKKIIIVTPTTLLATLGTIKNMWKFQRQNVNAQKIAQDAGKLLDKFRGFVEDLERLGTQISTVQKSYDGAMNKLVSGKGNLVASATKIQNLGVQMKKPLPKNIIEQSEDSDLSQD